MKLLAFCLPPALAAFATGAVGEEKFLAPIQCELGSDCFVQQYPDMDASPGARDPFCGSATYDGHQGTDFRLKSLKDIENDVPVVAVAPGTVLRVRDGEPDRLVSQDEQRKRLEGKECGNGVVIEHGDGLETQLCHLRQGSISVRPGESVVAGQRVGAVGASGMAQFPHVHLTVRQNGETIDPTTGKSLNEECSRDGSVSSGMFIDTVATHLDGKSFLLGMGLTGAPLDYDRLVRDGAPPGASTSDRATVGWAWFGNLQAGDRIKMEIHGPDGSEFSSNVTEPLERNKAVFSSFAGRQRAPLAGNYRVSIAVLRGNDAVITASEDIPVQ